MSTGVSRSRFAALVCLALFVPLGEVSAQPVRAGSEFQVSTHTLSIQAVPAVGMAGDGRFVAVWESNNQDGGANGIFGRRFDAAGTRVAAEFQVNTFTTGSQFGAVVGMDSDGDFVVVWGSSGQDGSGSGIFARRFNSAGSAQAVEFQINAHTDDPQSSAAVAMNGAGDFVVAWGSYGQDGSGYGIIARRFNSAGAAQGGEIQVNSYATGVQSVPSVAIDSDRDFVVAWRSYLQDGSQNGVFARRFNSAGTGLAIEFQVNSFTLNSQNYASVGMAGTGAFVVTWESQGQDGSGYGVFARRFSSAGAALATEFRANDTTANTQSAAAVAMATNGSFVIAWRDAQLDGNGFGVFARSFDSNGVAQGGDVQVNTYVSNNQEAPAIATDGAGRFVVAWESYGQDGQFDGVFAQRIQRPLAVLDIDGNGVVDPLTDSLLVLRSSFGFTGSVLVTGAVDLAGCTRCNAPTIEAYLATLK
jgi:hypothetical protein